VSEIKEKYQQQILFDEVEINKEKENLPQLQEQVVLDNETWQESDLLDIEQVEEATSKKKPSWLWRAALGVFSVLVVIETVEFFIAGFNQSPIIASLYGGLLFILSMIAGKTLLRELRGLRQFKHREQIKVAVADIYQEKSTQSANEICEKIAKQLPCDSLVEQELSWSDNSEQALNDKELLELFSRQVLSKVDQKALDKISKFSTEAVVLVALSPIAIVDMLLMLWRNLKMVDEIANLYGLKLSYWSRIKLIKQVFVNMVYAGATELIADVGAELIGADLLGKLSARLAQGLGAGMLTARLGLKTMHLCRPIPFDQDAPKLKDVRKKLLSQIKKLTEHTSKSK
jgi:putative membrane protein